MKSFFLAGLLLNFCVITTSFAEEIALNPTHPDKYTVVKGDTLWDIAGKFLQHHWQWKELWRKNTQIQNPHLIYPNDTIYFGMVDGKPQLSLSPFQDFQANATENLQSDKPCVLKPSEYEKGRKSFLLDKNNKVLPCMRRSEIEKPIHLIPHNKIAAFLTSPKVVNDNELEDAPYVVGFQDGRLIVGTGEKIYVKDLVDTTSSNYTIYRTGEIYSDADTGDELGREAIYIGNATLVNEGDPATFLVTKAEHEIRVGDLIMQSSEAENTLNFFPKPPKNIIEGHIIGTKDNVKIVGLYSVVVIDRGSADGLIAGHELNVYQKGKTVINSSRDLSSDVKLPDEIAGKIMIFRTFDYVSYALVMETKHDIHLLDEVKSQ